MEEILKKAFVDCEVLNLYLFKTRMYKNGIYTITHTKESKEYGTSSVIENSLRFLHDEECSKSFTEHTFKKILIGQDIEELAKQVIRIFPKSYKRYGYRKIEVDHDNSTFIVLIMS